MEEDPRDPRAKEGSDPMVDPAGGSGDLEDVGPEGDQLDAGYQDRAEDEDEPAP